MKTPLKETQAKLQLVVGEEWLRLWDAGHVQLDGTFTLEQLRAIIELMEASADE
jgi:hypothetical protein